MTLHEVFAGHPDKNLRQAQTQLKVALVARDFWVQIKGEPDKITRAKSFLEELSRVFHLRGRHLDQNDFEQVLKAFKNNKDDELRRLFAERVHVGPKKRDIVPRSAAQLNYLKNVREKDIVFGIGPAGTGKTYLAMAMAVSELLKGSYNRIILTRPAKEAGESLGFLPGNLEEKIMPYLRPLYDALYDMLDFEEAASLIERNIIEVAPLAFMRGRTLNNAFIILDEAQNTTEEQMLMFLTRLGFDSQCVITGDPSQTDLAPNEKSGLIHAEKTLKGIPEIGFSRFATKDVVRHALVEKIINAYSEER
ncbi:MAG: PhoH family protein [Lentisphaerae bacterium]|nr:PhoH family protein [Lentisphaerota bacterium]MCP4101557.1 PhoH family protein [Lentisphaerota bacterium]